jgi:hypothetical protein
MNKLHVMALILCMSFSCFVVAQNEYDIEREIRRIREELKSVTAERKKIESQRKEDRQEFEEYRKRTEQRFTSIKQETDSIARHIADYTQKNDSLAARIGALNNRLQQLSLQQKSFRKELIAGCESALSIVQHCPPLMYNTLFSSTTFLKSELQSNSIDNSEGISRLNQIIEDIEEGMATIQIVQGTPPVPQIRTTAFRLRIGAVFEAAVDADATVWALWHGWESEGNPDWKIGEAPQQAAQILKAVNIREGKAVPELISLPYTPIQREGESDE